MKHPLSSFPRRMSEAIPLMVLAGEASGDRRAAELVRALRQLAPDRRFFFFGSGGPELRAEGVETLVDIGDTAIIGPLEVARAVGKFLAFYRDLVRAARDRRPRAVILVDWPEFNLRIVRPLKGLGLTTIYYISPQVWAWRQYRVRTIRRYVDRMIVILPFEVAFYQRHGIAADYVGHPLVDSVRATLDRVAFCRKYGLAADRPILSLLPGSRRTEVEHILPIMIRAAGLLSRTVHAQWVIPLAPTIEVSFVRDILTRAFVPAQPPKRKAEGMSEGGIRENATAVELEEKDGSSGRKNSPPPRAERDRPTTRMEPFSFPLRALFIPDDTYNALAHSELAVVTSGTATLEAALLGTPLVVVYRARSLNYWLIRPLLKLDTFGMVNLIAGERIVPELIQRDLTPERLSNVVGDLLANETARRVMKEKLARVRERLGEGRAAERAARIVLELIGGNGAPSR